MSSLGEALESYNISGFSKYNPQQLTRNCVFVTMAYLRGISADELAAYINREMPPNDSH